MNAPFRALAHPPGQAVAGFLALCGVALAFGLARMAGLVETGAASRAMGVVVGLMAVVVGNPLPKLRPFRGFGADPSRAAATERSVARALVLAGLALASLHAFSSPELARQATPVLSLGTIALVALDVARLAWGARRRAPGAGGPEPSGPAQHTLTTHLLFGLCFVLLSAGLKSLDPDAPWNPRHSSWWLSGWLVAYSVLQFAPAVRRPCGAPRRPRAE